MVGAVRQPAAESPRFPFDIDFQKSLLRLVTEDESFGFTASKYLRPEHFESEILSWMYGIIQRHIEQYKVVPAMRLLKQATRELDPVIRPLYTAMVEQVGQASLRDSHWLRDAVLDFIKRNIFTRAFRDSRELYNANKATAAYDLMMENMEEVTRVRFDPPNEEWFFQDLARRQSERLLTEEYADVVPTGFPWLDNILGGGLSLGELGAWMAFSAIGKSTMLVNLGINACRRGKRVLHIVLEGNRKLIADRYEAAFLREVYHDVKAGNLSGDKYSQALKEYQLLKDALVIRDFSDRWDFNILDIDMVLRDLERNHGWRPHLIVIDYADLMTGREKKFYRTETESQRAAWRDVKRLTNRGYAIWSAAQAQRPKDRQLEHAHLLKSNHVADTYEKVRCCDAFGSLNATPEETKPTVNVIRIYQEKYRDNEADQWMTMKFERDKMWIYQKQGLTSPSMPSSTPDPVLGAPQQKAAW